MAYEALTFSSFEQPDLAKWNKLWANDAEFNARSLDGWTPTGETFVYVSADDPTYTLKIVGVDRTTRYYVGMRIKLTQSTGGTKYFIITKVVFSTDTTLTLYGGTDYDLNNEAITNPYFSTAKAPAGFPLDPSKWRIIVTTTAQSQGTPVQNTWYNHASNVINIPIGLWNYGYEASYGGDRAAATSFICEITISTANNTQSDTTMSSRNGSGSTFSLEMGSRHKILSLTTKATYYLNIRTTTASILNLYVEGSNGIIFAECAYL